MNMFLVLNSLATNIIQQCKILINHRMMQQVEVIIWSNRYFQCGDTWNSIEKQKI